MYDGVISNLVQLKFKIDFYNFIHLKHEKHLKN